MSPTDPATPLNPGLVQTVAWFNEQGFKTSDSGDGKTHDFECNQPHAYVVVLTDPPKLVSETERLVQLLIARSLKIRPVGTADLEEVEDPTWLEIQSSYDPGDSSAVIFVAHISDEQMGFKFAGL